MVGVSVVWTVLLWGFGEWYHATAGGVLAGLCVGRLKARFEGRGW